MVVEMNTTLLPKYCFPPKAFLKPALSLLRRDVIRVWEVKGILAPDELSFLEDFKQDWCGNDFLSAPTKITFCIFVHMFGEWWLRILSLPAPGYVILDKWFYLSEPWFSFLQTGGRNYPLGCGFPGGSDDKESICHAGAPWVWSLGWEDPLEKGNNYPLQYSCLENSMDRGAWWAIVCGVT